MVIRKRPTGHARHAGKARHSSSYLNGILYTAQKKSTTYNDIIPVNEQKKKNNFNDFIESILSRASKKYTYQGRPAVKKADAPKAPAVSIFQDRSIILTTVICIAIAIFTVIAVPVAFAKNEVTVTLLDSGRVFTAATTAKTVGEFLEKNNISLGEQDILDTSTDLPIEENMDIIIRRAMPLTVNAGADTHDVSMIAGTVSEALSLAGVQLDSDDEVYPSTDSYVRPGMSIDYINVDVKSVTDTKTVGYKEETREDDSMLKGEEEIVQYGEEGEMETVTKQVYKNGVLFSQDVVSEEVTKDPVNEIIAIGTKVIKKPSSTSSGSSGSSSGSSSSGGPSADQVREVRTMQSTAYSGDTSTATGTYPQRGTIAADPSVLPYGTRLYIEGYGYGRVEDTGGFVNWAGGSNTIDLFMNSEAECYSWGRRSVTVYILN